MCDLLYTEYGGSLPALDQIDNALCSPYQTHHLPPPPPSLPAPPPLPTPTTSPPSLGEPSIPSSPSSSVPPANSAPTPSTIALSPFSPENPFYGYPAIASASSPYVVRPVRKGLRELVHTLAVLWWRRWGRCVSTWAWAGACVFALVHFSVRRARDLRAGSMVEVIMGVVRTHMTSATRT